MKNIIKYVFILLLFCSFALISCGSKEEDKTPTNEGEITPPPAEITYEISLNNQFLDLEVGEEKLLVATLLANGKKSKDEIMWSTSDDSVASVSDGKVTAKGNGEAWITASAHNVSASAKITVTTPEPFLVLSATFMEIKMGKTAQLDAWLTVGEAQNVTFTSNNSVVTVSQTGLITALSEGEAVVTVTTGDGLIATCKVSVVMDYELIFPEIINKDVFIGDVIDLNTVVQVNGVGTEEKVEIIGDGFTVDGNVITIVKDGPITITAKYKNAAFSQTINSWIKISTTEEFLDIKNNLNGHYMLVNDLDFKGAKVKAFTSWNTWNANNDNVFKGVFDGQNHTIKNLQPIPESGNDAAIFGYMASGSIVRNVNFIGVVGEGRFSVVASWCHGLIENVYVEMKYISTSVDAAVATDNNPIGTLVAKVQNNATIRNCVVNLSLVEGADTTYFGALASRVYKGAQITNCYVLCDQSLPLAHVGAENIDASTKLITSLEDLNIEILESNAYDSNWTIVEGQYPHLGTIDAEIIVEENHVNAFAGISIHFNAISNFELTYQLVENVEGVILTPDGLLKVDENVANGTEFEVLITNLYGGKQLISVAVKTTNIKVSGVTDIEIDDFIIGVTDSIIPHNVIVKEDNTVLTDVSLISSNYSVAFVDGENITILGEGYAKISVLYDGVEIYSFNVSVNTLWYPIYTVEDFLAIGTNKETLAHNYMLMNDLDFEGAKVKAFSSWNTWNTDNDYVFKGIFDGQNHVIMNLQPVPASGSDAAIFGYMAAGSVVRNINFIGVIGEGRFSVVASWCHGLIENVYVEMQYISTDVADKSTFAKSPAGTLVAKVQSNATIRNCVVNMTLVEGADTTYLGALASIINAGADISNCYVLCNKDLPLSYTGSENADSSTKIVKSLYELNEAILNDKTYDSNWNVTEGKYPHIGNIDSNIVFEDTNVYIGVNTKLDAVSNFPITYSLVEEVDGVTITKEGLLVVTDDAVENTEFEVLITNNYGGQLIVTLTIKSLTIDVTSVDFIEIEECILGEDECIIAHQIQATQNGTIVTEGIIYTSTNEAVVVVDQTNITIKGSGEATIVVLYNGVEVHSFDVKVTTVWHPIRSKEEFLAIGTDKTTMSYSYKLMNDLDFEGATITEFSSWDTWNADNADIFSGKFEGQGYTISNFKPVAKNGTNNPSIFGYMGVDSVVRNVNFIGVIGEERFSLVSSYCLGTIENIYAEIEYISTEVSKPNANNPAGTLVGKVQSKAVIKNCVINLTLIEGAQTTYLGAFAGRVYAGAQITNCYVLCEQSLPLVSNGLANIDASSKLVTSLAELNEAIESDDSYGSNWLVVDGETPKVINSINQ